MIRKTNIKKGVSLITLLLSIAIILLLSVLIYFTYQKTKMAQSTNLEYSRLQTAFSQIDNIYNMRDFNSNIVLDNSGYVFNKEQQYFENSYHFPVKINLIKTPSSNYNIPAQSSVFETKLPVDIARKFEILFKNDVNNKSKSIITICSEDLTKGGKNDIQSIRDSLYESGLAQIKLQLKGYLDQGYPQEMVDEIEKSMSDYFREMVDTMDEESLMANAKYGGTNSKNGVCNINITNY